MKRKSSSDGRSMVFARTGWPDGHHPSPKSHFPPSTGTENVLRACVECGVPSLIYTSSMHVVGPNDNKDHFVR